MSAIRKTNTNAKGTPRKGGRTQTEKGVNENHSHLLSWGAVSGAFGAMNGKQCCDERGVLSGERGILRVNKFDNIEG
jgi:hypothetical protein